MNVTITNPNQIATFVNAELGIAALVTKVSKGYAVTQIGRAHV